MRAKLTNRIWELDDLFRVMRRIAQGRPAKQTGGFFHALGNQMAVKLVWMTHRKNPPRWYRWYRTIGVSALGLSVIALFIGLINVMQAFWIAATFAMVNIGVLNWIQNHPSGH